MMQPLIVIMLFSCPLLVIDQAGTDSLLTIWADNTNQATNIDSTIAIATRALVLAQETGSIEGIGQAAQLLSEVYQNQGQYEAALKMEKQWKEANDSMQSLHNQETGFRSEHQNKYNKITQADQRAFETYQARDLQRFYGILGGFFLLTAGLSFYFWSKFKQLVAERKDLVRKIDLLKEKIAIQSLASAGEREELSLDKAKIEQAIGARLGESSWMILNVLFKNPSISNKAIAEAVSLSVEGVSSSLRRMYTAFEIKKSNNKKIALITKVVRISLG